MNVRVISISWSHIQCSTLDRDNMSTLLLAIISLKHVTASRPLIHTAAQTIIFQLQFNYEKTRGFYVHAVLVGRLSRRSTGGLAEFFFRPASRGLAKSSAA